MRVSQLLKSIATWLQDPENEALLTSEHDDKTLEVTASYLVKAAQLLNEGAEKVEQIEPSSLMTPDSLDEMAALAAAFDESGDELLQKQASVLDEILLTIGSDKDAIYKFKKAEEAKIEEIKKKYNNREETDKLNSVSEAEKALKASPAMKQYRSNEAPLSTRTCIDHPGAQLARVGENSYQCSLDSKIYDYENGFTTLKGNKVPGGGVQHQTPDYAEEHHTIFDTRESRLNNG